MAQPAASGPRTHFQPKKYKEVVKGLKALMDKVKPDFRGNLGPPVELKTATSIKQKIEAEHKKWAGDKAFAPFKPKERASLQATHVGKRTMSADGTRPLSQDGSLANKENRLAEDVERRASYMRGILGNPFKQELDSVTQKPLITQILSWGGGAEIQTKAPLERPKTALRIFPQKYETSEQAEFFDAANVRAVRQDLEALTPRHRTALIRQICMANPKFTKETRIQRSREHWDPMSQLLSHAFAVPPPPKPKPAIPAKAAPVRVMPLMRKRASSAGPHPWK